MNEMPRINIDIAIPSIRAKIVTFIEHEIEAQADYISKVVDETLSFVDVAEMVRAELRKQIPIAVERMVKESIKLDWQTQKELTKKIGEALLTQEEKHWGYEPR